MKLYTDTALLELIVNDNYKAFTAIYDRYFIEIKRFGLRILKSPQLAEDITQEVFVQIWANRAKLNQVRSIKAYLLIAARNRALDSLKAAFRSEVAMGEILQNFVEQRNIIDDNLLDKEYRFFLDRVLATLPERSRQIFTLCREQGKSYDEVADILGISRNAIKNHMVYSMKVLGSTAKQELGISLTLLLTLVFNR